MAIRSKDKEYGVGEQVTIRLDNQYVCGIIEEVSGDYFFVKMEDDGHYRWIHKTEAK